MDNTTVKEQVRERYGAMARKTLEGRRSSCCEPVSAASSCCEPASAASECCAPADVVSADLAAIRDALPQDIASTALGCGTPLGIAKVQPGETVLDLGSGGGLDCFYASKLVVPSGRVIGVDMTQDMLTLARANAQKVGATNVEFRQGELENLPLDNDAVDVIISNCVVNLAPDKDRVFQEAFRVLKPGGRVAISDMVTRVPMSEVLRSNMAAWAACVAGAITEQEYVTKMRAAGFVDVEKIAGGETYAEPVYSAKFVARKS